MEFHSLANYFPMITGDKFEAFVDDIRTNGQLHPIVLFEGKILDGRNRYRACQAAGIEPHFTTYEGKDPVSYVISLNTLRRDLSNSQRAIIAATYWAGDVAPRLANEEDTTTSRLSLIKSFDLTEGSLITALKILESCEENAKHSEEAGLVWARVRDGELKLTEAKASCDAYTREFTPRPEKPKKELTEAEKQDKERETNYKKWVSTHHNTEVLMNTLLELTKKEYDHANNETMIEDLRRMDVIMGQLMEALDA